VPGRSSDGQDGAGDGRRIGAWAFDVPQVRRAGRQRGHHRPERGAAGGRRGADQPRRRAHLHAALRRPRLRPGRGDGRGGGRAVRRHRRAGEQRRGQLPFRHRRPVAQRLQRHRADGAERNVPRHPRRRPPDDRGRARRKHPEHRHHLRVDRVGVRGPFRGGKGGGAGDDEVAGGGVGHVQDPQQRHRPRPVPDGGRMERADAHPRAGGRGEGTHPHGPLRRARRAGEPGRVPGLGRGAVHQRRGGDHRRRRVDRLRRRVQRAHPHAPRDGQGRPQGHARQV
ncbi:MAG: 2,4-dienoyl-CoA reductase, mitochondrial precursor, partial [uncultured Gemmatimonadetes bacterium]